MILLIPGCSFTLNRLMGNSKGGGGGEGGGGEGGGACFVKGTLVATERGLIPIEQINVEDNVYAFDIGLEDLTIQKVMKTFEAQREEILVLDFGIEKIRCTPPHRFYTGRWVPAKELRVGDLVLSRDGRWKGLKEIGREIQPQPVFNLNVQRVLNYFVGQSGLLVHNDKVETTDQI